MGKQILKLLFLLFSSILASHQNIIAQHKDIKFLHLTVEHGLAGNTVNGVILDSRGFIWISTENGVSRYDGINFKNFRYSEDDSLTISSNITYVVFEDKQHRLWVGSEKGLDLFNPNLNKFDHHYFKDIPVRAIFQDSKGNLWIGSDLGLYLYNPRKKTFYKPFPELFNQKNIVYNTIPSITEDEFGKLWIGTSNKGAFVYDPNSKSLRNYSHTSFPGSLSDNNIRKIILGKNNTIWISTYGGGINRFDQTRQTFKRFVHKPGDYAGISNNAIPTIWEDEKGKLWIGTDGNGIDIYDPLTNEFNHVVPSHYNSRSLNNNVIRSINSDGRGGVWVGTYAGGINFYNQNTEGFFHYKVPTFNGNNSVMAFAEDDHHNLWIGTDGGGLSYFNRSTGKFYNYIHNYKDKNSLSDNRVLSLLIDNEGILWIGTYLGGLCKFNTSTKKFTHYTLNDHSGLSDNIIWDILEDSEKRIWVATNNGLNLYDRQKDRFSVFNIANSNISNNMVRSLFEDNQTQLWIGTQEGLNLLNKKTNQFTVIKSDLQKQNTLSNHWIRTINQDKEGNLWIGTFDGGLNLYDQAHHIFKPFKESDGLPDNMICGILPDQNNNIWISTGKGLGWLHIKKNKIKNYYGKDGLQDNQFNINSCYITKKGEFLFGGINGFTLFVPQNIEKVQNNQYPPAVALTSFKIFNKEVNPALSGSPLSKDINETHSITLDYEQSVVTFEFSALNFIQPENNQCAYRLLGFEKEWNFVGNKRSATYTNLDPGSYIFQVKAANNDGIWNQHARSIDLQITPPFWETWWFKAILTLIFVSLALFIFKIIRERIREKIRINKLISELEIKALIAQMNPHFIFNCLTSIQELIMVNKQDEAMHYLHQFSKLLRTVLESSEKNFIPLELELTLLELYLELESMRFDKQFHYEINIQNHIDPEEVIIPSFLIQPFVENALWHGLMHKKGERNLSISFELKGDDVLVCNISDNGIGREAAAKIKGNNINAHRSMGIRIIKERMKIMKFQYAKTDLKFSDKIDENGKACGTTVTISLPLGMHDDALIETFEEDEKETTVSEEIR